MIDGFEAQKLISRYRGDAIVLTTMTTSREWPQVSTNLELDFPFVGAMGKASSMGLGLALARPDKKIIVLDGDGSLLMNLGSLVTIANQAPPNFIHFVMENEVYRTTGGQPIPRAGELSFVALAKAAGYPNAYEFEEMADLEREIEAVFSQPGPTLVCLKLPAETERAPYPSRQLASEALNAFKVALEKSVAQL